MKIKVCGMKTEHNVHELLQLKPDFIGFIFYEKSPRYCSKNISISNCESTKKIGVFVNESIEKIIEIAKKHNLNGIQLHGSESPEFCKQIASQNLLTIKAFNVENVNDFEQTKPFEGIVDFFLFDTKTPAHGGSGQKFDWQILNHYKEKTPFFLSGGISENHVEEIKNLQIPLLYAIDINSRFETEPALKDIQKIKKFTQQLQKK